MMSRIPEKLKALCDASQVISVIGHYGSGKTEAAMNLAIDLAQEGKRKIAIADLDIVNPYFRSRDYDGLYEKYGIRLMASSRQASDADLPTIPSDLRAAFDQKEMVTIFDVGGDPTGAHVLRGYQRDLNRIPSTTIAVVNANRPQTATWERAEAYLSALERSSGCKIDGIIGNTHLCRETTEEELQKGRDLCMEIHEHTGRSILCHMIEKDKFSPEGDDVYPIQIFLRKPWEM